MLLGPKPYTTSVKQVLQIPLDRQRFVRTQPWKPMISKERSLQKLSLKAFVETLVCKRFLDNAIEAQNLHNLYKPQTLARPGHVSFTPSHGILCL